MDSYESVRREAPVDGVLSIPLNGFSSVMWLKELTLSLNSFNSIEWIPTPPSIIIYLTSYNLSIPLNGFEEYKRLGSRVLTGSFQFH